MIEEMAIFLISPDEPRRMIEGLLLPSDVSDVFGFKPLTLGLFFKSLLLLSRGGTFTSSGTIGWAWKLRLIL